MKSDCASPSSRLCRFSGVTVELRGGLGNQLFCWAAGNSLAKRIRLPLRCDKSGIATRRGPTDRRSYELGYFGIDDGWGIFSFSSLRRVPLAQKNQEKKEPIFIESSFEYDPRFEEIEGPIRLRGYFQSPKYFWHHQEAIKNKLLSASIKNPQVRELADTLGQSWTAVHVRLGDYARLTNIYNQLGLDYYNRALTQLGISRQDGPLVVFSDSPTEAREVVQGADLYPPSEIFRAAGDLLLLMSQSSAFVGANSTLSWWAGFLGFRNPGDTIFPAIWFSSPHLSTKDLLDTSWCTVLN